MKEFLINLVKEKFNVLLLFLILVMLIIAHMVMIHWSRPPEMIHWVEGLIEGVFAGLLGILGARDQKGGG
jgi:hypothetical protein